MNKYDTQELVAYYQQASDLSLLYFRGSEAQLVEHANWHQTDHRTQHADSIHEFIHTMSALSSYHERDSLAAVVVLPELVSWLHAGSYPQARTST
jgi:hypothetical protein